MSHNAIWFPSSFWSPPLPSWSAYTGNQKWFVTWTAPGGVLLASGIIEERIKDVTDKAAEKGFSVDSIDELKGWAAIRFRLGTKP